MVLALGWAAPALAQQAEAFESPDYLGDLPSDENYGADPDDSFVVEQSGDLVAAEPREPAPSTRRCRQYLIDDDDPYAGGFACPQPDGSWRIVSGPDDAAPRRAREPAVRERSPYAAPPDYTEEARVYNEDVRRSRRFRLDWDAWSSSRRGPRARERYDD